MKKFGLLLGLCLSFFLVTQSFASEDQGDQAFGNHHPSAPHIRLKQGTSSNWSGYAVETNLNFPQNYAVSDVKGTWVVPTLLCDSNTRYSSAWVGIDGYSDGTVEQTGTEHDCVNGNAQFSAWYEMYPRFSHTISLALHANDVIAAEVKYIGSTYYALTLTNKTTGQSFSTTQRLNAKRQSAEWIAEAPSSFSGVLPLANFQTMQFSNAQATLNGIQGPISNWPHDPLTMLNPYGMKSTPSALSTDGSAFSATWSN